VLFRSDKSFLGLFGRLSSVDLEMISANFNPEDFKQLSKDIDEIFCFYDSRFIDVVDSKPDDKASNDKKVDLKLENNENKSKNILHRDLKKRASEALLELLETNKISYEYLHKNKSNETPIKIKDKKVLLKDKIIERIEKNEQKKLTGKNKETIHNHINKDYFRPYKKGNKIFVDIIKSPTKKRHKSL
jgi:hypothetical protein